MKKKRSLVGWTVRKWELKWDRDCDDLDMFPITKTQRTWDKQYFPLKKVRITIEEIS